jgi:hypothetical protein
MGDWVNIASATGLPWSLEDIDPSSLVTLPASSAGDHDLTVQIIESPNERLDLANLIVSFDVELPKISSVFLIILFLSSISISGDALSH